MALQQNQHYSLLRKKNGTNKLKFGMSRLLLNEINLQEYMLVARLDRPGWRRFFVNTADDV